jgi:hypothetical protein
VRDFTPSKKSAPEHVDVIERRLKEAEERRLSIELSKLALVVKDKERAAEVSQRVIELNESFSREAEKKLAERMETIADNKNAQIRALQDRLREHALRVEQVRKLGDQSRVSLKEKIERKLVAAEENRDNQLTSIQERIRKHKKHIDKVIEQSSRFSKYTEEKIILKMEASVKNREKQISSLMERLKEHERRMEQVRLNRSNLSTSVDSQPESSTDQSQAVLPADDGSFDESDSSISGDTNDSSSPNIAAEKGMSNGKDLSVAKVADASGHGEEMPPMESAVGKEAEAATVGSEEPADMAAGDAHNPLTTIC